LAIVAHRRYTGPVSDSPVIVRFRQTSAARITRSWPPARRSAIL